MAYTADITALSPQHLFSFDGVTTDSIAGLGSTSTSIVLSNLAIAEDATNCITTNATTDLLELDGAPAINQETNRLLVCGWFSATKIQQPPCRIYGDGATTSSIAFHLGFGNQVLFEANNTAFNLQIYGDTPLVENRYYHIAIRFESNSFGNKFEAFLDGVQQLNSTNTIPNDVLGTGRALASFGGKASGLSIGGAPLQIVSVVNGQYNHWAFWNGTNAVAVSNTQIRTVLFEKGAKPTSTILTDTEINMQTSLNLLSGTARINTPLDIRIEDVTTTGNLSLNMDNIVHDALTSIHVQWMGTGILTLTNINGSNTSIVSTPNGGTVVIINPKTLTINGLISGSQLSIFDDEVVDYANFNTRLDFVASTTTTYIYNHDGVTNDIIIEVQHPQYEEIIQQHTIDTTNQILELFPKKDIN